MPFRQPRISTGYFSKKSSRTLRDGIRNLVALGIGCNVAAKGIGAKLQPARRANRTMLIDEHLQAGIKVRFRHGLPRQATHLAIGLCLVVEKPGKLFGLHKLILAVSQTPVCSLHPIEAPNIDRFHHQDRIPAMPDLIDCVGGTPLIRLKAASDLTGCEILGKAEFMNPGGSVKDRAALGMIMAARERGELTDGATIVEGTAGNTGIGLAMIGAALGHPTTIVMPDNQSAEKIATLRAHGADVRLIPAVPYKDQNHFVHTSRRLAASMNDAKPGSAWWADQFENLDNRSFHEQTTGAEIWQQTNGNVDGFVCAAGTGGSLGGIGRALKSHNPDVCIALSDPGGSGLHNYFANGEINIAGSSISEGIGNSRITANLEDSPIDMSWQIDDNDAIPLVHSLIRSEGLLLGGSSGINIVGAIKLAQALGPGHTIVTLLCDSGLRYQARLFNRQFLAEQGLPVPDWLV